MEYMKQIIIAIISIILVSIPLPKVAEHPLPTRVNNNSKLTTKKTEPVKKTTVTNPVVTTPAVTAPAKPAPVVAPTPAPSLLGTCDDWIIKAGITEVASAKELIRRESGCNPFARNASSGAYGIPQSLPAEKMASAGSDWQTNPVTQLVWMKNYTLSRYGSFANAIAFHNSHNWY